MCVAAWRSSFFDGAALRALFESSRRMAESHLRIGFAQLLWSHLWIDHMYALAKLWRNLARFSCFDLEGSLRRLLRNSGGVCVLKGRK